MKTALIVSCTEQSVIFIKEMLKMAGVSKATISISCEDAREKTKTEDYDIVIINTPLRDGFGEGLAIKTAKNGISQVVMVVKGDYCEEVEQRTEGEGIYVVPKPVNKTVFWSVLKIAKATFNKIKKYQNENDQLKQKLEDVKLIDKAKWVLISYMGMSEHDAHKYIEKQAMDLRKTKREISEGILKTYDN